MTKKKFPIHRIESCRFKRTKNARWEKGILIDEGCKGIMDKDGKIPKSVWDYNTTPYFVLPLHWFFGEELKQKENKGKVEKKKG